MADALSSLAAVVGLADVTCRIGKELYVFFNAIKHASQDVQTMLKELQQLDTIISGIHTLAENNNKPPFSTDDQLSFSAIFQALHDCKNEFETLRELVEKFKPNQQLGAKEHLANKVKWILDEKKITKSCRKLERLKLSLTAVLTSVGWQNSVKIQHQLKFDREDISKNQEAAALQNQAFHNDIKYAMTNLQTSSTQAQVSLNDLQVSTSTGISNLQDIAQTTQINTTTVQRQIQEAQVTVSTGQNEIRGEIVQASSNTSRALRIVSKNMKKDRKLQMQSQKSLNNFIRKNTKCLGSILTQLSSMTITSDNVNNVNALTDDINLETITMPLMLMKSHFSKTLAMLAQDPHIDISNEDADMLLLEFNKLLAASHAASANVLKQDPSQISNETINPARTPTNISAATSDDTSKSNKRRHQQEKYQPVKRRRPLFGEYIDTGHLVIGISGESNSESRTQSQVVGALFMPLRRLCQIGVYMEFKKIMRAASHPTISRCIRTFKVTKLDSAAILASRNNDVSKLQSLFSEREASPWDRDDCGHGLIQKAARHGAEEACRLLVQEGATFHDCYMGGHNVLWAIWLGYFEHIGSGYYRDQQFEPPNHLNHWIKLSDFFIRNGALVEDCHGLWEGYATLLHLPSVHRSIPITPLAELCRYFLRIGCDMEARNSYGQTAFLHAAMCSADTNCAAWLQILIDNGANIAATDKEECNALHCAFIPIGPWGEPQWCKDEELESKLNVLLQAGCDPNSVNCYGETPSDFARRFKRSKIWKSALEKAGIDSKGFDAEDLYDDSDKMYDYDEDLYDDPDKTDDGNDTASNSDSDQVNDDDDNDDDSASQDLDSDGGVTLDHH
ncbi:MAG: hypothetical protein Q9187_001307 [Circinaria calcarea]